MDLKLTNKLAFVSGSTDGIGYAIAESLALEGAGVIINGRSEASVEGALGKLRGTSKGALYGFAGDMSELPHVKSKRN
jgi:NAD(P)-dependent dehydrogenase (short-subunit alcohol dehydrogenase family)